MNGEGPGGTTNKVYILYRVPDTLRGKGSIYLATQNSDNLFERVTNELRQFVLLDPLNDDIIEWDDFIPRVDGKTFSEQFAEFMDNTQQVGGRVNSTVLKFKISGGDNNNNDEDDFHFELHAAALDGSQSGGRRQKRQTRKQTRRHKDRKLRK